MKHAKSFVTLALGLTLSGLALADSGTHISAGLESVEVQHKTKLVKIERTGDKNSVIPATYAKNGRHCPPFCVQPITVAQGVETIGELELLGYLKRIGSGDRTVLVVDSRSPEWLARGTIPGSVNIPWNLISVDMAGTFAVDAEAETLATILKDQFGAHLSNGQWDFRNAKTLVLFCNGLWCPQSGNNIKTLIRLGYPTYKLKWYRGGMQDWVSAGLTTANH